MARKQFILVAGVDFENFKIDHAALCLLRVNELVADHKGTADLKFLVYDFKGGTITTINVPKKGLRETPIVDKRFNEITKKDYNYYAPSDFYYLKETIKDVMTIPVVYNEIIGIGKDFPGELIEWSFFCNEFFLEFTLTNSGSDKAIRGDKKAFKKLPAGSRDPDEPDPYFTSDFRPPNMGKGELELFKKAFNKREGYCWLWSSPSYISKNTDSLYKFLGTLKEVNDLSLPGDTIVDLKGITKKMLSELDDLIDELPPKSFNPKSPKVPLSLLRFYFCYETLTPTRPLLKILNVKVYSTFRNIPVEFDKTNKTLPVVSPDFEQVRQFLKKQLGVRDAPQGNFIELLPGMSCKRPVYTKPPEKKESSSLPSTEPGEQDPKPVIPFTSNSSLVKSNDPFFRLEAYQHHYVFVAGIDYKSSGTEFFKLCTNRINTIIASDDNRDTTLFQVLDFGSGKITYAEVSYETGKRETDGFEVSAVNQHAVVRISKDELMFFEPVKVDAVNYSAETNVMTGTESFFNAKAGVMTVQEIYRRIVEIGKKSPGHLMELSFFSHGEEAGPQLLHYREPTEDEIIDAIETNEESILVFEPRFFDPSPYFDFDLPLMDDEDLTDFKKAFHQKGYSWIWGYDSNEELRKLIKAVIESKEYKAAGLTEDTMITLRNPTPRLRLFVQRVAKLVKDDKVPPVKIQLRFGLLLRFFAAVLKSSYMYHLARVSGKEVYGGLPGVIASVETGINEPLMAISPAFNKYSEFFREHFGFDFDSEIRGYGKYGSDFPWDNSDLAGVRIDEKILDEVKEVPVE